jgi:hypothetical protein
MIELQADDFERAVYSVRDAPVPTSTLTTGAICSILHPDVP